MITFDNSFVYFALTSMKIVSLIRIVEIDDKKLCSNF